MVSEMVSTRRRMTAWAETLVAVRNADIGFGQERLGWNTVKDCLHTNARRPHSPVERVSQRR